MLMDERGEFADAVALNTGAPARFLLGDVVDLRSMDSALLAVDSVPAADSALADSVLAAAAAGSDPVDSAADFRCPGAC